MRWNVIALAGSKDVFGVEKKKSEGRLVVPFDGSKTTETIQTSLPTLYEKYDISPSDETDDFLRLAISVYSADVRIPRSEAYDQWTRDIRLFIPVSNVELWNKGRKIAEKMLSFLTGDHWELSFRELDKSFEKKCSKKEAKKISADTVSLFSGGLDSFCGAIDSLTGGEKVILVGHHSAGAGATSKSQARAIEALRVKYSEEESPFFKIWVTTPKGKDRVSEITTRGRSLLFIGLGVFIANGFGVKKLVVPENGLISINVPLTNSRLGSYSTRTTHPYFISLVSRLLTEFGIDVTLDLPYRFKTKGEMLDECLDVDLLKDGIADSMSCSHPSAGRYAGVTGNPHCGYCIPCLIRRAAIDKALSVDPTKYSYDINDSKLTRTKKLDQKTLCMTLDRQKNKPPIIADILVSGPLPVSDEEKEQYLDVYKRGMEEVRRFIGKHVSV
jgi:hypothetical protein